MEFETPRHPRRPGARAGHRLGQRADLPDLDVRAGRRQPGALRARLRAHRQPDADGAAGVPRVARGRRARRRVLVRAWRPSRPSSATFTPGTRTLAMNDVYGGTYRLFSKVLEPQGYTFEYADLSDLETVENALTRGPGVVWVETPTNPLLKVVDIAAIAERAHSVGAVVVVDNTFASPYLQQPLALGADIVVHSTTKYIGGHSDAVGGIAITSDDAPPPGARLPAERDRVGAGAGRLLPDLRGAKTLAIRMREHCANAGRDRRVSDRRGSRLGGALSGPRHAREPRGRGAADARLRRHGLVPPPRRPRGSRRGPARDRHLVAGREPRRRREPGRASRRDDARVARRLRLRGARRPDPAVGRHRARRTTCWPTSSGCWRRR